MKLPPLPTHTISGPPGTGSYFNGHTDDAMEAYGKKCIESSLEEAAKVCDTAYDWFFINNEFVVTKKKYDAASVKRSMKASVELVTEDCAEKIRRLK